MISPFVVIPSDLALIFPAKLTSVPYAPSSLFPRNIASPVFPSKVTSFSTFNFEYIFEVCLSLPQTFNALCVSCLIVPFPF